MFSFKKKYSLNERIKKSVYIITKYPKSIPVIIQKQEHSDSPLIDKNKFIVPNDLTFGQFFFSIRKRFNLIPEESIYLFINNKIPPMSALMSSIYKDDKDTDGFLYIFYTMEQTFG